MVALGDGGLNPISEIENGLFSNFGLNWIWAGIAAAVISVLTRFRAFQQIAAFSLQSSGNQRGRWLGPHPWSFPCD